MPDMLVKLYALPELDRELANIRQAGVIIRSAMSPEKVRVMDWVNGRFVNWGAEVEAAFSHRPVSCFLAVEKEEILGFACYDVTCRNFFGPMAVSESARRRGLGKALLLAALHAQKAQGYAYSIIGGVGPAEFYRKSVGAVPIEGSSPGVYGGLLLPLDKG